ncbi:TonB-dependent receptor [Echinicola strongylocentroti]|uniref:TonB-dependent receptor n=1 Tax=Echinicola strongylocentroti TaxID=1795355 RepID=A0A2Z4IDA3_9BACT|nr:TonB-dependent receptor [Echinicola strongylocentroti]AWW28844.1 TonB-dependent receptor [Echinicola strongylocentroti]
MKIKIYLIPRNCFLWLSRILCFLGLLLGQSAYGFQDRTISGTVISDSDNLGLPGVNVVLKGSQKGTITDIDGNFSIRVPDGSNNTLVFSMIGFEKKEISIGNSNQVDVTLSEDISSLDEVIVVGYGTVKKSDLTGAVTALKKDDFNPGVITSAEQLIAGKMPGVQVVQNSAEPGGGISVNIRGVGSVNSGNSPLYVIDGLPFSNSNAVTGVGDRFGAPRTQRSPLSSINPADIESIEVLKDASATAIYGARGANGVILVTTKNGEKGKMSVNYDGYAGVQNVANKIEMLTGRQYYGVINAIIDEGGGSEQDRVEDFSGTGTDWLEEVYQPNAGIQSHNLSMSGGNESTNYMVSLNYFDQKGLVINSGFKRYGIRFNLEHQASEKFKMGLNMSSNYSKDEFTPGGFQLNEHAGVVFAAMHMDPSLPIKDENGEYVISSHINIDNPLALANGKRGTGNTYRTFGTIYGEYKILPGLSAKLNIGGDVSNQVREFYIDRSTLDGNAAGGIASQLQGTSSNYLIEGLLNYAKDIGENSLRAVVGVTTQKFIVSRFSAEGRGFPSDATQTNNLGLGNPALNVISSSKVDNTLLSYLARVNYSLKNKYLLTGSIRADGSSRFGQNNKFGYFPSFAFGWKVNQENFFTPLSVLFSTMKFRASWGRTGNQEIGNYRSISTFGNGPVVVYNDQQYTTTQPARIANPDLRWETTEQINFGLDYGLWDDRLYGSLDWYVKNTSDMLLSLPIPRSSGFTSQLTNIGGIQNSGWEFGLTSRNITNPKFSWLTNIALTTVKNKVTDLGGINRIVTGSAGATNQIAIIEEGLPLESFYGYEVLGVWQEGDDYDVTEDAVQPGDVKYKDVNGDGVVNSDDRVVLGNSFPDLIWSLGNTLKHKNLELYVFIEGVQGAKMLNNGLIDTYFPAGVRRNRYAEPLLNRWTPENPTNEYPSFVRTSSQGEKRVNSKTVEDASYLRLSTVRLSYNLPVNGKTFRSVQFYMTGQNLFTLTDYSGMDPAINPNGSANFRIDWNAYPVSRTFTGGISLTF